MAYGKFKTGKAKPRPLPTPPSYIPGSGSGRAKPMPIGIDALRNRSKGTPPTGTKSPYRSGERMGIMPVKPGLPSKPGSKRPGMGSILGEKPISLKPRTSGKIRDYGPPIGRKPFPGNDDATVRPRPLPRPRKPNKRGM